MDFYKSPAIRKSSAKAGSFFACSLLIRSNCVGVLHGRWFFVILGAELGDDPKSYRQTSKLIKDTMTVIHVKSESVFELPASKVL